MLDPMAQEEEIEQEMLVVEGEQFFPPQMDPEPEMGAAAAGAAVHDTSPLLPHQNPPPIPAETVRPGIPDMAQLFAMLVGIRGDIQGIKTDAEANTNGMREEMKEMRGEMRQVGQCLQADKMAALRAEMSELKGSAPAGEDRAIRET